jgi:energy-coupling factor transporter ATP-binding protein EcfA2
MFPERYYSEGMEAFKRDDLCGLYVMDKTTGVKTHIDLGTDEFVIMPGVICTLL